MYIRRDAFNAFLKFKYCISDCFNHTFIYYIVIMVHDYEYEDQGHGETVIVMGGRRTTKHHPFHVSMHVEDEFGSCLRQRINANTSSSSRQSEENDLSTGKYLTPDSRRLDDSGFPQSPDVGSDPDW